MTQLETLANVQGRLLLQDIYRELRYERRLGTAQVLGTMWRICTKEQELIRTTRHDVVILHPLGWMQGTALWMQEVVNRFYYSAINAWVYAGAAVLLLAVGLNRVGVIHQPAFVVGGIVLEAALLLVLFVVMYYTPPEEPTRKEPAGENESTIELLREIGEIGRDYAAMAVQLEAIAASLAEVVEKQETMNAAVRDSVQSAVNAVAPNPTLMNSMEKTSASLDQFADSINKLGSRLQALEAQEVQRHVRAELERLLSREILKPTDNPETH
ncbi:MAG: hypothetical protein J5I53_09575, partial [Bradyrhizobiaceae bacterium]|nr:hypothetical protein [Bradyrhizobiaceae bacterium]